MDNLNYWPYTDIHELNLDWIIEKVKALDTKLNDDIDTYVQQYIDDHFEDWTVNANYDPTTQTIVYTNGTGAQQTLGDVIRFAIDNVFVDIKDQIARNNITSILGTISGIQTAITTINNILNSAKTVTDLDDAEDTGFYTVEPTTLNNPTSLIGAMLVIKKNSGYAAQLVISNNSTVHARVHFTTGWQPWINLTAFINPLARLNGDMEAADVNNISATGMYTVQPTAANLPDAYLGALIHIKKSNSLASQILVNNHNEMFFRIQYAAQWQPWTKVTATIFE